MDRGDWTKVGEFGRVKMDFYPGEPQSESYSFESDSVPVTVSLTKFVWIGEFFTAAKSPIGVGTPEPFKGNSSFTREIYFYLRRSPIKKRIKMKSHRRFL